MAFYSRHDMLFAACFMPVMRSPISSTHSIRLISCGCTSTSRTGTSRTHHRLAPSRQRISLACYAWSGSTWGRSSWRCDTKVCYIHRYMCIVTCLCVPSYIVTWASFVMSMYDRCVCTAVQVSVLHQRGTSKTLECSSIWGMHMV